MILFFEKGRLGNQIFQYVGLRKYFPEHKIWFVGGSALEESFSCDGVRFIPVGSLPLKLPFFQAKRLMHWLAALRLVSVLVEDRDSVTWSVTVRRGLIFNLIMTGDVYFQAPEVVNDLPTLPSINPDIQTRARTWLIDRGLDPDTTPLVGVHVRRGDYLHWPSRAHPAVLGADWYRRAMASVSARIPGAVFVLMGDDPWYLRDVFGGDTRGIVSDNPVAVDLGILSQCRHTIISPSSLAWWGAYLSHRGQADPQERLCLAPLYWAGHRSGIWNPVGFQFPWIEYQDPDDSPVGASD